LGVGARRYYCLPKYIKDALTLSKPADIRQFNIQALGRGGKDIGRFYAVSLAGKIQFPKTLLALYMRIMIMNLFHLPLNLIDRDEA